jgi:Cysteine-rich CWC
MEKHAPDSCQRCGEIFVCKANNVLQCDCMKVSLTKAETEYIRDITEWEYDGNCLCVKCLEELKKEVHK